MSDKSISVRLPADIMEAMTSYLSKNNITQSGFVRDAVRQVLAGESPPLLTEKTKIQCEYIFALMHQPCNEEAWQLIKRRWNYYAR